MTRGNDSTDEMSSLEKRYGSWRSAASLPARRQHQDDDDSDWFDDGATSRKTMLSQWLRSHSRLLAAVAAGAVVLLALGWWMQTAAGGVPGVATDKFQAVFLVDGTAYVGKLQALDGSHYKLTNAYFITANSTPVTSDKDAQSAGQGAALSRLDTGLLSPQNEVIIPKDKVLLYENLKADGSAAKLITDDLKKG